MTDKKTVEKDGIPEIRTYGLCFKNVRVEDGFQYAVDVCEGKVLVCKWVRLACERFLRDMERANDENDTLEFSYARAQHVLDFATTYCVHVKGKRWRGKPVDMMDFHAFILINIFGFIVPQIDEITGDYVYDEDNDITYIRRFRHATILVARKNAKSFLASVISLYMLFMDGEGGAEIYSAATTREQAKIVFDDAKEMVKNSLALQSELKTTEKAIFHAGSYSRFMPVSSDAGTLDGKNTHLAIIDEIHAHKKRDVYDVMETSTSARDQPLVFVISTAGVILDGICVELKNFGVKVLNNSDEAEDSDSYFFIWYTMDEEDYEEANVSKLLQQPELWFKANPGMGVCKSIQDMKNLAKKAKDEPTARANFLTKHLNVFVNGSFSWCNMEQFRKLKKSDNIKMKGKNNFILALDLAEKIDICAAAKIYFTDSGYMAFHVKLWLPEGRLDTCSDAMRERYESWYSEGLIKFTSGNAIDFDEIREDLREWIRGEEDFLVELAYDPWRATQFAIKCNEKYGWEVVEVPQVIRNLNESMNEVQAAIASGKLYVPSNRVVEWMFSNVQAKRDRNGNTFPDKSNVENKIDVPSAIFTGVSRIIRHRNETTIPEGAENAGTI